MKSARRERACPAQTTDTGEQNHLEMFGAIGLTRELIHTTANVDRSTTGRGELGKTEFGSPKRSARRPASVVAARTEMRWPRIARIASSNPSNEPGRRNPGQDVATSASRLEFTPASVAPSKSKLPVMSAPDSQSAPAAVGFWS